METTAITMAFFIFLILKNPNILAKVKEEVMIVIKCFFKI